MPAHIKPKKRAPNNSLEAQHNANLEDLRNKLSRTIYSIVGFHIINTGMKLKPEDLRFLKATISKSVIAGHEFAESLRRM